jgi:hypothetical protein
LKESSGCSKFKKNKENGFNEVQPITGVGGPLGGSQLREPLPQHP